MPVISRYRPASVWPYEVFVKLVTCVPLAITGIRGGIAALLTMAAMRMRPRMDGSRAHIGAIAGWVLTSFSLVLAMRLGAAADALALTFSAPLYVALLGHWVLGETLKRRDVVALAAAGIEHAAIPAP